MQPCTIHHQEVCFESEGIVVDGKAYIKAEKERHVQCFADISQMRELRPEVEIAEHIVIDGEYYFPPFCFGMLDQECHYDLTQIEVDGKWGFVNVFTAEIVIEPQWDWTHHFYGKGYSLVIDNNHFGYINLKGEVVAPIKYELNIIELQSAYYGFYFPHYTFSVDNPLREREKDAYYKQIEEAVGSDDWERYLILKHNGKFGVVSKGTLLQEPTLTWEEIFEIIKSDWEKERMK
jgi:hypothetical protein